MADEIGTKVSQLPLGENLADSDLMYAVEGGISKKVEVGYLKNRFVGDLTLADLGDDSTHRLVTDAEKTAWNSKADESDIPTTLAELGDDSTHRLVTDTEKAAWDAKANVEANPLGEATAELTKVGINNTIYEIIGGEKIYGEAIGAIASFSDGSNNPLVKLEADINPIQDLHGYDKPWAAGAGANIWDEEWELGIYSLSDGSPVDSNYSIRSTNRISVKPNTQYYFNNQYFRVLFYDSNDDFISYVSGLGVKTTPSNCSYVRFYLGDAYGTTYNNDISINYPSTITTYQPYSNICPINGRSSVEVTVAGKNLANLTYGDKVPSITTGEMVSTYGWSSDFIKLDKNKTYVLSSNLASRYVLFYDKDKTYLGYTVNYSTSGYVLNNSTYWNNTSYIKLRVDASGTATMDVQLEVGSTATSYEAYNADTETISLGQTVYGGKLNITTGELTVDRALGEYDGSSDETWTYVSSYGGFRVTIADANINGIPSEQVISNRFVGSTSRGATDKDIPGKMLAYTSTSDNTFLFFTTQITDLSEWQAWLSENITQVEYPLATPTTITLTPTQISSLLGSNNIWADSGDSDVVYIRDVNLFLNQLDARVKALENA